MSKILVGLFLVTTAGFLSSCKFTEGLNAAVATWKGQATGSSAAEVQAAKTAQAEAEAAAQAAKMAQAHAEQAAQAALAAQTQAEQFLASLQNGSAQPAPTKTVDKKVKKVIEKKPVTRVAPPAPAVVLKPAPRAAPVAVRAPVAPAHSVAPPTVMGQSAQDALELEEEEANVTADNYAAKGRKPARAPASVGGATASIDANRKAENEARFKRALTLFESRDEQENVKLTIIEPDGTRKLREVAITRLGLEGEQRMMARVISPADLKGAGVLVVATKQRDNQWVYLPSSKQTRKVVVAEQKGVILGSELRYEDFNPAAIRRSSVELLKQERIEGKTYDIFEVMIPPGTVPYEKAWVWIDPKSEMPIQIEYFTGGDKVKRIDFSDYYKVGDIWRPAKLSIKNLKTKRGTDIEISNVKVNTGIAPDRLSVEALSKIW